MKKRLFVDQQAVLCHQNLTTSLRKMTEIQSLITSKVLTTCQRPDFKFYALTFVLSLSLHPSVFSFFSIFVLFSSILFHFCNFCNSVPRTSYFKIEIQKLKCVIFCFGVNFQWRRLYACAHVISSYKLHMSEIEQIVVYKRIYCMQLCLNHFQPILNKFHFQSSQLRQSLPLTVLHHAT